MTLATSRTGALATPLATPSDEDATRVEWSESGHGRPIVLLHGDTTASVPVEEVRRGAAGLGRTFEIRRVVPGTVDRPTGRGAVTPRVLDDWFREIGEPDDVTLVLQTHAALDGIVWARRRAAHVRAIVLVDPVVRPRSSRELLDGGVDPAEAATLTQNAAWLSTSHVSKLLVAGPGVAPHTAEWAAANVRNLTVEHLDPRTPAGDDLGRRVRAWLARISWSATARQP